MPTNRTRRPRAPSPDAISRQAIEAWQAGDFHQVNRIFGIAPCEISPFDAHYEHVGASEFYLASQPRARALREALIAVAGPPGRVGRHGEPLGRGKA